jgi:hypothetical protein
MVDRYGTPQTEALHVVERYRLLDPEAAKEGFARDAKQHNALVLHRGLELQVLAPMVRAVPHSRADVFHDAVDRDDLLTFLASLYYLQRLVNRAARRPLRL